MPFLYIFYSLLWVFNAIKSKKKVKRLKDLKKINNFVSNNAKTKYCAFQTFFQENLNHLISQISFKNEYPKS